MDPHFYRLKANGIFNLVEKLVKQNERPDNTCVIKDYATIPKGKKKNIFNIFLIYCCLTRCFELTF